MSRGKGLRAAIELPEDDERPLASAPVEEAASIAAPKARRAAAPAKRSLLEPVPRTHRLPLQMWHTLADIATARTRREGETFTIEAALAEALNDYFIKHNFPTVNPPPRKK